jgi:hypothetical protein
VRWPAGLHSSWAKREKRGRRGFPFLYSDLKDFREKHKGNENGF